jgi:hypothetical protein
MPSNEPIYSFRTQFPDVLQVERAGLVKMDARRAGVVVPPSMGANYRLEFPDGRVVYEATGLLPDGDGAVAVSIPSSALSLTGDPPIELGELYQSVWTFIALPGVAGEVEVRRGAAVARFQLHPPVAQIDMLAGEYPDLVDQLGSQGDDLQPYLDKAWGWCLRRLFRIGRWPDLLVTVEDLTDTLEHRTLFGVFKYLFSRTSGDGSRWKELMDYHRDQAEREWTALSGRWDDNHDGRADHLERQPAGGVLHRNAAPRTRLRRSSKW